MISRKESIKLAVNMETLFWGFCVAIVLGLIAINMMD